MSIEEHAELEHLLVVDDDPEIRELTQEYLQQQGFHVATVASGEEMDTYLSDHEVDLQLRASARDWLWAHALTSDATT